MKNPFVQIITSMNDVDWKPIWISVRDVNHYFSIGKTRCYELLRNGEIESRLDKKRGAKIGKRLIKFESVERYIESLPTDSVECS